MKAVLMALVLTIAGCRAGPTDASMAELTRALKEQFPEVIVAISFENAPPLDPPTIFIDTDPALGRVDEVSWLCTLVKPRVDDLDATIEVESTNASLRTDCP